MTKSEEKIRLKGDLILRKINAIINYGTGKPDYFPRSSWDSVTNKTEMKQMQVALWKELREIDPSRADLIKPQDDGISDEKWMEIKGVAGSPNGQYSVSSLGNVKNNRSGYEKSQSFINSGYLMVDLHFNNVRRRELVHRLVASAFIPNKENKPCVHHKDGNKTNNRIDNLSWVTYLENNSRIDYRFGEDHHRASLTQSIADEIRAIHSTGNVSQMELANRFNVSNGVISLIINNKTYTK